MKQVFLLESTPRSVGGKDGIAANEMGEKIGLSFSGLGGKVSFNASQRWKPSFLHSVQALACQRIYSLLLCRKFHNLQMPHAEVLLSDAMGAPGVNPISKKRERLPLLIHSENGTCPSPPCTWGLGLLQSIWSDSDTAFLFRLSAQECGRSEKGVWVGVQTWGCGGQMRRSCCRLIHGGMRSSTLGSTSTNTTAACAPSAEEKWGLSGKDSDRLQKLF